MSIDYIYSEFRHPRQMLATQEYDGHLSIHDDKMAENLGFAGAPIEGPTHFSAFVHLLVEQFGDAWFERGCISAHYQNMVVEGEEVRAFVQPREDGANLIRIGAEKRDGTPVLTGTASLGPDYGETEIDQRMARLRPSEQLVILSELQVGQQGAGNPETVVMEHEQNMGDMYPFSLAQKLDAITETHDYYQASPFGGAVIPMEMISVLTQYSSGLSGFRSKGPAVGLFAGQEVKMIAGPLLVGKTYHLEREIIALSESRRTESNWIKSRIIDPDTDTLVAEVILNSATLKDSYANYAADAAALGKVLD
ncbi:MAG: hypothetical protein AAF513_05370 [Pseudomonadota bacterium]